MHVLDDSLPPLESMRLSVDALYFTMHHVQTGAQWLRMLCGRTKRTVRAATPDVLLATTEECRWCPRLLQRKAQEEGCDRHLRQYERAGTGGGGARWRNENLTEWS